MNKKIIISGLVTAGVIGGIMLGRQIQLAQKACYEVQSYKLQYFGLNRAVIKITFKVKNTTGISFTIHKQSYKVYVNNREVANVLATEDMQLNAYSEAFPSIVVEFSPKDAIRNSLAEILSTGKQTAIRVVGKLSLKSGMLFYNNLKVDTTTTLYEILNDTSETIPC